MSDSTKDQKQHVRRGSLLDHAGDAHAVPVSPRAPAPEPAEAPAQATTRGAVAGRRPAPSLLAARPRTARLSTASHAADRPAASSPAETAAAATEMPPEPAPSAQAASVQAASASTPSNREKFGDRIARLIGTVPPQDRSADASAAADAPVRDADTRSAPAEQPASWRSADAPSGETAQRPGETPAGEPAPRAPAPRRPDQGHDDHYHWHEASGGMDDSARPLLDASILLSAVVRYRNYIAAAAVAGAVVGVLLALSTPHRYYAESRLFIDPREVRVTEDDIRDQQLSTEAMLAITDSQLQILSSTSVLEKVVTDLGLERDPEFNGSLPSGGLSGGLTLIKEIFTGEGGPSEAEQKALEKLRRSLTVSRDSKTFVIIVGVTSRDAEKSALIANQVVETYLDSEGRAQSSLLERTSESIDTRINALRSDLDAAERAVEKFKAENGLVGVGGQYIDDKVILALSDQLANARAMKVGIRVKANNLANVNIDDVLSGAFPEELLSSNLTELRKQYTETKSRADSLATSLGPRHPQYIAASSSLETIRNEISAELRRIVASSQTELQRAVETEQELASQMAVAKSRAMDQSVEFVTLRELERKAAATRGIYEAFLTRSRETSERSNFTTRNIRVISPAEAPLQPTGPSRKLIAIGGMFAGFFAGLGLALLVGAIDSIRSYNAGPARGRFQEPPFGAYPVGPGPRTPPDGSARRRWSSRSEEGDTAFDRAADEATASAFAAPRAGLEPEPARPDPAPARPARSKSALARSEPAPALDNQATERNEPQPVRRQAAPAASGETGRAPASRRQDPVSTPPAPEPRPAPAAEHETPPMYHKPAPFHRQPAPDAGFYPSQPGQPYAAGFPPAEPARAPAGFAANPAHVAYAAQQPGFEQPAYAQPYGAQSFAPQPAPQATGFYPAPQPAGFYPAPHPAPHDPRGHDPRGHDPRAYAPRGHDPRAEGPGLGQPLWTAYPGENQVQHQPQYPQRHQVHQQSQYLQQPQYQPQPHYQPQPQYQRQHQVQQPPQAYPHHVQAAPVADPYPAFQSPAHGSPVSHAGYAPVEPQSHYQPQAWPSGPQPFQPANHAHAQASQSYFAQPYSAPPAMAPAPAWQQAAPPMPHAAAPAQEPVQPAPRPQTVDAVDRIRREMDVLRSRIDGYGAARRHG
tara:strand:+ start:209 stop:3679 length:3471 start_codon:yes stop_codon:yes gene_type:complete